MGRFDLSFFSSPRALAAHVADAWLEVIAKLPDGMITVALSGGRIALAFYEAIVAAARSKDHRLADVHFFWADERCVPPEHPQSNFAVANHALLKPLKISDSHVHRIRGELPPNEAAAQASSELQSTAGPFPTLDFVFLGMGEDGHVASLFPNAPEEPPGKIYYDVIAPKPPPERVTLSYGVLARAREAWVLVSGAGKEDALKESLKPVGSTPLACLIGMRRNTQIWVEGRGPAKFAC